jgi:ketosteroid isomerase-like protein
VERRQGRRATQAIKNVYNALLLDPPSAERVIKAHFEAGSAQAFLHVRPRISVHISRVRTTDRRIRIGVDASSARRAVATVSVSFKGKRDSKRLKVKQRATLWLERVHDSWKVVAWRARRGPG